MVNGGQSRSNSSRHEQRPGSIRGEATPAGTYQVESFDGKDGWKIDPFQRSQRPGANLSRRPQGPWIEDAPIGGPLEEYKVAPAATLEYPGTEDIDGTAAHKLKLTQKNGDMQYVYLDPDYFLEIRIESQRIVRGVKETAITDLGEYEKVAGVYWAISIERAKGDRDPAKFFYEKVEVNSIDRRGLLLLPRPREELRTAMIARNSLLAWPCCRPSSARRARGAAAPPSTRTIISGLGARNIGSAAMSGRIAALDAVHEADGKLTIFVGAASGGVWKSDGRRHDVQARFDDAAGAVDRRRRRSTRRTRRSSGSARANRGRATACRSATASTSRPTAARPGRTSASPDPSASPRSSSTRATATRLRLRPGQALERFRASAASTRPRTAARPGSWSSRAPTSRRAAPSLSMDRDEPGRRSSPALWDFRRKGWTFRSGGERADGAVGQRALRARATAAPPGPSSRRDAARVSAQSRTAASRSPSRRRIRTRLRVRRVDRRARSSLATTAARPGRSATSSQWMVWRPFYFANLIVDPKNADRVFKTDGALICPRTGARASASVGGLTARTATSTTSGSIRTTRTRHHRRRRRHVV